MSWVIDIYYLGYTVINNATVTYDFSKSGMVLCDDSLQLLSKLFSNLRADSFWINILQYMLTHSRFLSYFDTEMAK